MTYVKIAMNTIQNAIHNDWGYAHSWWCNLKFSFLDRFDCDNSDATQEQIKKCEDGATSFMQLCFDYTHDPDGYQK